ncbi:YybH family protein [Sunxiuqinia sp. A32]|uniref:YybH family protein n=1 Tax=Sunxiuqinia sp. A32 TaxID=3461496 RepID=UPI004045805A
MKQKVSFTKQLFFLFLSLLIVGGCAQKPVDVSAEIQSANDQFVEAYQSGDAQAVADRYTADAKVYPENSDVVQGTEAIAEFWAGAISMGVTEVMLQTVSATRYGNMAVEDGRYMLHLEGGQMVDQGKYVVTWEMVDGQWKISKDIWNSSNPAKVARAAANDTVWVVWNVVKKDKVAQFEDFNFNYLDPAAKEFYPELRSTVRILRPVSPNDDGTSTYVYLMDPAIDREYSMKPPLEAKYGSEKADEYLKMFEDCLKGGKQQWVVTTQTSW